MLLVLGATPLQLVLRLMLLPDNFFWTRLSAACVTPVNPLAHADAKHWLVGAAQPHTNLSSGSC